MNFVSFHRPFASSLVLSEAVLVLVLVIETPLNLQANLRACQKNCGNSGTGRV